MAANVPSGHEKGRGVSAHSANQAKLQHNSKQRTPIQLLQAKHKHLEVQLAKLSHEVALQNREIKESSGNLPRSASNRQLLPDQITDPYDLIGPEYFASPLNAPFDPE